MMTRKDYVKTARILRDHADRMPATTHASLVHEFACLFAADNDRFVRAKFVEACTSQPVTPE